MALCRLRPIGVRVCGSTLTVAIKTLADICAEAEAYVDNYAVGLCTLNQVDP
jgi:hypothetical protein